MSDKQYDYVINAGGPINHKLFINGGEEFLPVHFCGLLNLVNHIDQRKLKRFINIGINDEYGGITALPRQRPSENHHIIMFTGKGFRNPFSPNATQD